MKQKVLDFINRHFVPGSVELHDCSFFPGGIIVRDSTGGQMLFFYDFTREQVMCCEPGQTARPVEEVS